MVEHSMNYTEYKSQRWRAEFHDFIQDVNAFMSSILGPHLPNSLRAMFWKAEVLEAWAQQEWLVTMWFNLK